MGAPTRHDLKTQWRFSVPQLAYITPCGCANCLAIGRAGLTEQTHTRAQTRAQRSYWHVACSYVFVHAWMSAWGQQICACAVERGCMLSTVKSDLSVLCSAATSPNFSLPPPHYTVWWHHQCVPLILDAVLAGDVTSVGPSPEVTSFLLHNYPLSPSAVRAKAAFLHLWPPRGTVKLLIIEMPGVSVKGKSADV